MTEKCGVCDRPKGDPHRYPVAGECTAPDSGDYTVSLQCLSIALRKAQDDLKAAEERGRRRGLDERDELRACLELARGFVAFQYARNPISYNEEALARIVKALAPRDSAPQHKDWCALFGNPEAGKSCDCRGERK